MAIIQAELLDIEGLGGSDIGVPTVLSVAADSSGLFVVVTFDRNIHTDSLFAYNFPISGLTVSDPVTQPSPGVLNVPVSVMAVISYTMDVQAGIKAAGTGVVSLAVQSKTFTGTLIPVSAGKRTFSAPHHLRPQSFGPSGAWGDRVAGALNKTF